MTDLNRLEELLAKATKGPWEACEPGDYGDFDGNSRVICSADPDDMRRIAVVHWFQRHPETDANAALIVEAINALPALIARVRELEEALAVLRDLPIVENDNPDTLHLDGEAHTGPAVDYLFRLVRKVKEIARRALAKQESNSHD